MVSFKTAALLQDSLAARIGLIGTGCGKIQHRRPCAYPTQSQTARLNGAPKLVWATRLLPIKRQQWNHLLRIFASRLSISPPQLKCFIRRKMLPLTGRQDVQRRYFLSATGKALALAVAAGTTRAVVSREQEPSQASSELEERVASVLQAFDSQGNHRTGTAGDQNSAEWLADEVRRIGINPLLEPFALSRIDPQLTYTRIGDRRIEGVPMFDGGFTSSDGVSGRLGPLGSDAEIGLAERPRETVGHIAEADVVPRARRSRHKAVIVITGANRPGLFLSNASTFLQPSGPPIVQVSNVESEWLQRQTQGGASATVVAYVKRTPAQAINVTASVQGREPSLAPLVVMAPRSGWWQCVSEQGSRIFCWLEIMRSLAAAKPRRTCHFVALSGHELGFMGMAPYLELRGDMIRRAEA